MLQRDIFCNGEGKAWLERNKEKLGQSDPVSDFLEEHKIHPCSVLEIGAADGWRLRKLSTRYTCDAIGIDPSGPNDRVWKGSAAYLSPFRDAEFDLVIFGFCLYLCDPQDYFRIASESNRVLKDRGHLIIHDFEVPHAGKAYRLPYEHKKNVYSHHVYWAEIWRAHPYYRFVQHKSLGEDAITLLKKDTRNAFFVG